MQEAIDDLLRALKYTAGSRFNAGKRLERLDRDLTRITAFSSAYVVILTVFPYFVTLPKGIGDNINLITVSLSIIIMVSSLLQYSGSYTVKAEQMHRSALEINELRRELKVMPASISIDNFTKISSKYSSVLQKYSLNHDDIDFWIYQLDRADEFPWMSFSYRIRKYCYIKWNQSIPPLILLLISGFVFSVVLFYAVPHSAIK